MSDVPATWNQSLNPFKDYMNDTTSLFNGALLWDIQSWEPCRKASGFDFRIDSKLTIPQLSTMCTNSNCIQTVNNVVLRYLQQSPDDTLADPHVHIAPGVIHPEYTTSWERFANLMLSYCTFYHVPGESCPPDALTQLLHDLQPLVDTCETHANVSILNIIRNVDQPTSVSFTAMCNIPECDSVMRRLYLKVFWPTSCPYAKADNASVWQPLTYSYMTSCNVTSRIAWREIRAGMGTHLLNEALAYSVLPGPQPPLAPRFPPAVNTKTPSDTGSSSSTLLPVNEPNRDTQVKTTTHGSNGLTISIFGGLLVLALIVSVFVYTYRRRRTRKKIVDTTNRTSLYVTGDELDSNDSIPRHHILASCPNIPIRDLTDIRIIGGGGFGVVYLVHQSSHNRLLASKRLNRSNPQCPEQFNDFLAEISLAASLSHPHIVGFVGVAGLQKTNLQALFEYMPGGDLRRYLDTLPEPVDTEHAWSPEKLQIAIDIADALVYLHTMEPSPIVHRDLKSRNVLLTMEKRAKVGDFGISRTESAIGTMTTGVGTSRWVAPEVILGGGGYTTASDMYSLGVVLSELDTQRLPYSELAHANGEQLADFVVLELVVTQHKQPSFRVDCPLRLLTLAKNCLSFEPSKRPTAEQVATELRAFQQEDGEELREMKS